MVVFNYSGAEINAKVVYYGPALSGKTTNLECIYEKMPDDTKGKMVSMKTRTDRTLFFDFLPLDVGEINGYQTRILLYTVPGQVYYNATRKLVLKGADAVVFVADSDPTKMQENIDSLRNLEENLNEHGLTLDTMPWVIQYNKRDLPGALPVDQLASRLNLLNVPGFEASAATGQGVYETFRGVAGLLYGQLVERLRTEQPAAGAADAGASQPTQSPEPEPAYAASPPAAGGPTEPPPPASQAQTEPTAPVQAKPPAQRPTAAEPAESGTDSPDAAPAGFSEEAVDDASLIDVVDTALREVDPTAGDTTESDKQPEPPPTPAPADPTPKTAPSPAGPNLEGTLDLTGQDRDAAEGDDMGRVVDFQDSSPQTPDTTEGEFITDPFRSADKGATEPSPPTEPVAEPADERAAKSATKSAAKSATKSADEPATKPAAKSATKPAPKSATKPATKSVTKSADEPATQPAPKSATKPATQPDPSPETPVLVDDAVTVTVPVYLTRSQMRKTVPIQIELDIQIDDEDS